MASAQSVPFVVDAKGGCFMCLQQIHAAATAGSPILSLKLLTRYLKVEFDRVFDISSPLLVSPLLKDRELGVPLCEQCVAIFGQFTLWYRQLELVRLKLEGTVRKIAVVMVSADRDSNVVCQYSSRTIRNSVGPQDLMAATISDKLRKEVAEKASNLPKRSSPKVELNEIEGKLIPTGFQLPARPAPPLPPPPPLATARRWPPRNKNYTKNDANANKSEVEVMVNPTTTSTSITPDPPVVVTETVVTRDQIQFRKLANGKYQCGLCSTLLSSKQSVSQHKSLHSGTKRRQTSFQCKYCKQSVPHLHHHYIQYHLYTYFTKYQDPRIVSEQFESVVETLFSNLAEEICQRGNPKNTCAFCDCLPKLSVRDARGHMIRQHMDDLIPRLMSLQQAFVMDPTSIAIVANPKRKTNTRKGSGTVVVDSGSKKFLCAHCGVGYDIERSLQAHTFRKHPGVYLSQYKRPNIEDKTFNEVVLKMFRELDVPKTGDNLFRCGRCKWSVQQFKYRESVHKHYVDCHMEELGRKLEALLLNHPEAMMMMGSRRRESEIEGFGGSEDEESIPIPIPDPHDEDVEVIKMEDAADSDNDISQVAPMDFLELVVTETDHQNQSTSLKQEYYESSANRSKSTSSPDHRHQSLSNHEMGVNSSAVNVVNPFTSKRGTTTLEQPEVEQVAMMETVLTNSPKDKSQSTNNEDERAPDSATTSFLAELDLILGI